MRANQPPIRVHPDYAFCRQAGKRLAALWRIGDSLYYLGFFIGIGGPIAAIVVPIFGSIEAGDAPSVRAVLDWLIGAALLLGHGVVVAYLGYRIREGAVKKAHASLGPIPLRKTSTSDRNPS